MPRFLLILLALLLAPSAHAIDESDLLPIDEAFALSARADDRNQITLTWKIADGYYLYRHRTRVQAANADFQINALTLPPGKQYTDEFFGEVETYRGELVATLAGVAAASASEATLSVSYQGCADIGICYPPHTQTLRVTLPSTGTQAVSNPAAINPLGALTGNASGGLLDVAGNTALPEEQAFKIEAIADTPNRLLLRLSPAPGYYLYRDKTTFALESSHGHVQIADVAWPSATAHQDAYFGESSVYFQPIDVPITLLRSSTEASTLSLTLGFQGCQSEGICYPPMSRTITVALPAGGTVIETPSAVGNTPLWLALLLALGGGLILNLMPCVLPVLSLKALSVAQSSESHAKARRHALWYTAGVLVSFAAVGAAALALREAGLALGWGFQLQQPVVVTVLAYVMFVIGLSLSGVVNIGANWAGAGQRLTEKSGPAGDFFTGVLAVVVASPCTAPFMGTALAFAFAATPAVAMAVFLALGLGLALPFLLIGFVPALASRLPRPGAWMESFKQLLAFPMYLTAAWLISVLAAQRGADAVLYSLAGAVVLALGLWLWERTRFRVGIVGRTLSVILILLALWPLQLVDRLPANLPAQTTEEGVLTYSAESLATLRREGRVVFVNMTADWCVSCKANEKAVLGREGFRDALAAADAVYMKGDWTTVDPAITAFLEEHGAIGVPLYVVFPRSGGPGEVLPTLLTQGIVEDALRRAAAE